MIAQVLYRDAIVIDSSGAIALTDPTDQFHIEATAFLAANATLTWVAINATAQESYTRIRYTRNFQDAISIYNRLEAMRFTRFELADEARAKELLVKYSDQQLSFHDAICAAVMHRLGLFRIFTFDRDFYVLGFEVLPGFTR